MLQVLWRVSLVYRDGRPHEFYTCKYLPMSDGMFLFFTPLKVKSQKIIMSELDIYIIDQIWRPYTTTKKT